MLTKSDAEIGRRVVWRSPDTGETRFGAIVEIIDNIEIIVAYDDSSMGIVYIGNELSNVHSAGLILRGGRNRPLFFMPTTRQTHQRTLTGSQWSGAMTQANKFIAYYRVSTDKQGQSGLGLEAQQKAVADFLNGGKSSLIKEYTEVESGKVNSRPQLAEAIQNCRAYGAKLVIAKLDRLSRDAHFLLGLEKAGIDFVAADMPNANRLTVGIMAMVAE